MGQLHRRIICSWNLCHIIADEQERVQKKTFTNWCNSYLRMVSLSKFIVPQQIQIADFQGKTLKKPSQSFYVGLMLFLPPTSTWEPSRLKVIVGRFFWRCQVFKPWVSFRVRYPQQLMDRIVGNVLCAVDRYNWNCCDKKKETVYLSTHKKKITLIVFPEVSFMNEKYQKESHATDFIFFLTWDQQWDVYCMSDRRTKVEMCSHPRTTFENSDLLISELKFMDHCGQ